ncbi:hypothetical protein GCM10027615_59090 [Plantactinospora veratri]
MVLGVLIATAVSFVVASALLGFGRLNGEPKADEVTDGGTGDPATAQPATEARDRETSPAVARSATAES